MLATFHPCNYTLVSCTGWFQEETEVLLVLKAKQYPDNVWLGMAGGRGNFSVCKFPAGWWTVSKGTMKLQYGEINFKWSWHSWWLSAKQEAKHKPATEINIRKDIHGYDITLPVFTKASIFCTLTGRLLCCLPAGYLHFPLTNIPQKTNWICSQ